MKTKTKKARRMLQTRGLDAIFSWVQKPTASRLKAWHFCPLCAPVLHSDSCQTVRLKSKTREIRHCPKPAASLIPRKSTSSEEGHSCPMRIIFHDVKAAPYNRSTSCRNQIPRGDGRDDRPYNPSCRLELTQ